jgi:hypothetical protein
MKEERSFHAALPGGLGRTGRVFVRMDEWVQTIWPLTRVVRSRRVRPEMREMRNGESAQAFINVTMVEKGLRSHKRGTRDSLRTFIRYLSIKIKKKSNPGQIGLHNGRADGANKSSEILPPLRATAKKDIGIRELTFC